MIRKKKDNIEWLEFELLSDFVNLSHGVFLRKGGVSQESQFASLNLSPKGERPEHLHENRRRVSEILDVKHLASAHQIHSNHIMNICESKSAQYENFDGLMTSCFDLGLLIIHADCQAALFYDPIHHVCANVHAGWRGQAKNIYKNTILNMKKNFGTNPFDLLVCISPSLGPQNSEFIHYKTELPEEFWPFQIKPHFFNLWAISRHQLEAEGILPHHIQIAELDTFSNEEDFFSYRREKKKGRTEKITGGHGTLIALKTR